MGWPAKDRRARREGILAGFEGVAGIPGLQTTRRRRLTGVAEPSFIRMQNKQGEGGFARTVGHKRSASASGTLEARILLDGLPNDSRLPPGSRQFTPAVRSMVRLH
jgi:hypothetical protein